MGYPDGRYGGVAAGECLPTATCHMPCLANHGCLLDCAALLFAGERGAIIFFFAGADATRPCSRSARRSRQSLLFFLSSRSLSVRNGARSAEYSCPPPWQGSHLRHPETNAQTFSGSFPHFNSPSSTTTIWLARRGYTPPVYPPHQFIFICYNRSCVLLLVCSRNTLFTVYFVDRMMATTPNAGLCGRWPWASGASVDPLLDGYGTNFDEMQQDANETFTAAVQRIWQRPAAHGSVAKDLPRLARRVTIRTRTGRCATCL